MGQIHISNCNVRTTGLTLEGIEFSGDVLKIRFFLDDQEIASFPRAVDPLEAGGNLLEATLGILNKREFARTKERIHVVDFKESKEGFWFNFEFRGEKLCIGSNDSLTAEVLHRDEFAIRLHDTVRAETMTTVQTIPVRHHATTVSLPFAGTPGSQTCTAEELQLWERSGIVFDEPAGRFRAAKLPPDWLLLSNLSDARGSTLYDGRGRKRATQFVKLAPHEQVARIQILL